MLTDHMATQWECGLSRELPKLLPEITPGYLSPISLDQTSHMTTPNFRGDKKGPPYLMSKRQNDNTQNCSDDSSKWTGRQHIETKTFPDPQ